MKTLTFYKSGSLKLLPENQVDVYRDPEFKEAHTQPIVADNEGNFPVIYFKDPCDRVQCEHGYDVCPTCDPCTCEKLMNTPISPCDDRIVVEPHEPKVGSIIIPEAHIHDHIGHREGTVLAIGTGKVYPKAGRRIPLHEDDFEVGDKVMYHKWAGSEMTINGRKVVVMQAKDVLAVCVAGSINAALDEAP